VLFSFVVPKVLGKTGEAVFHTWQDWELTVPTNIRVIYGRILAIICKAGKLGSEKKRVVCSD
jgi:hypothetical protein